MWVHHQQQRLSLNELPRDGAHWMMGAGSHINPHELVSGWTREHDEIKKQVASSLNGGELLYMQAMSCVGSHQIKYCK